MDVEVRPQILERHALPHLLAVANNVEVRLAEVDDSPAVWSRDVSVPDIPLVRHGPVENLGTARHLVDLERKSAHPPSLSVSRTPSPVMLQHKGKTREASACMRSPAPVIGAAVDVMTPRQPRSPDTSDRVR